MKDKLAFEIYNYYGTLHCRFYYMNNNAIRIDYVKDGVTWVKPMTDTHIVYSSMSVEKFIADCRKNGIVVPKSVINNYWKNN